MSEESTSIRRSMEARSMEADIEERGASRGAHRGQSPPLCVTCRTRKCMRCETRCEEGVKEGWGFEGGGEVC